MTSPKVPWSAITQCRACLGTVLCPVADFGETPLSDRLGVAPNREQPAPRIPLQLVWCEGCRLPQLSVTVAPEALYDADYPYYSSVSPTLMAHFADLATDVIDRLAIGPGSAVLEAASNDGYLLRHFAAAGATVLGFDPSTGPASVAKAAGIPTRTEFFGLDAARALVAERGKFDLFLANNVLAHVPDLRGFVEAIAHVLKPGGTAVIEVPYLADLVEGRAFDTIYHQHLCYFPLASLVTLFSGFGLGIVKATPQSVHGGSLRLEIVKGQAVSGAVLDLVVQENVSGRNGFDFVSSIGEMALSMREALRALVTDLKDDGATIWAYGAAAKANTLLSFCDFDDGWLEAVGDLNHHKHGRYMPGANLRITSPDEMMRAAPSHVLVLAWNFRNEILAQLAPMRAGGTRFVLPIPRVEIV